MKAFLGVLASLSSAVFALEPCPVQPVAEGTIISPDELVQSWTANAQALGNYEVQFSEITTGHLARVADGKSNWAAEVDKVQGVYVWREGKDFAFKVFPAAPPNLAAKWVGDAHLDHEAAYDGDKFLGIRASSQVAKVKRGPWKYSVTQERQVEYASRNPYALFFPADASGPLGSGHKQVYEKAYDWKGSKRKASMVEPYKLFVSVTMEMREGVRVLRVEDWQGKWSEDGKFTPLKCMAIYFADPAINWLPRESVFFPVGTAPYRSCKVATVMTTPNGAFFPRAGTMVQYVKESDGITAPPEAHVNGAISQFTREFTVLSLGHGKHFDKKDFDVDVTGKIRRVNDKEFTPDSSIDDVLDGKGKEWKTDLKLE